jgi:hypothetical protein
VGRERNGRQRAGTVGRLLQNDLTALLSRNVSGFGLLKISVLPVCDFTDDLKEKLHFFKLIQSAISE